MNEWVWKTEWKFEMMKRRLRDTLWGASTNYSGYKNNRVTSKKLRIIINLEI